MDTNDRPVDEMTGERAAYPNWRLLDILTDDEHAARIARIELVGGKAIPEVRSVTPGPDWLSVLAGYGEGETEYLIPIESVAALAMGR